MISKITSNSVLQASVGEVSNHNMLSNHNFNMPAEGSIYCPHLFDFNRFEFAQTEEKSYTPNGERYNLYKVEAVCGVENIAHIELAYPVLNKPLLHSYKQELVTLLNIDSSEFSKLLNYNYSWHFEGNKWYTRYRDLGHYRGACALLKLFQHSISRSDYIDKISVFDNEKKDLLMMVYKNVYYDNPFILFHVPVISPIKRTFGLTVYPDKVSIHGFFGTKINKLYNNIIKYNNIKKNRNGFFGSEDGSPLPDNNLMQLQENYDLLISNKDYITCIEEIAQV